MLCSTCLTDKEKIFNHHYKLHSNDTVPVCVRCNNILNKPSTLFRAWIAWHPDEYPPLNIQKRYVEMRNRLLTLAMTQERYEVLLNRSKSNDTQKYLAELIQIAGDTKRGRKLLIRIEFWKPFYLELFPDINIYTECDTREIDNDDLDKVDQSLPVLTCDNLGIGSDYPLPTCLERYWHKSTFTARDVCDSKIYIAGRELDTKNLSVADLSTIVNTFKKNLREINYHSFRNVVGIHSDISLLKSISDSHKRRFKKNQGEVNKTSNISTSETFRWEGCLVSPNYNARYY
jgi:hypothetical protein